MATILGNVPNKAELALSIGADWICTLIEQDKRGVPTVLPEGTQVWCEVGEQSWDAVVTASEGRATFVVQSEDCDLIKNNAVYRIYRRFPDPSDTIEQLWFTGKVRRRDS